MTSLNPKPRFCPLFPQNGALQGVPRSPHPPHSVLSGSFLPLGLAAERCGVLLGLAFILLLFLRSSR